MLRLSESVTLDTDLAAFEAALRDGEVDRALSKYGGEFLSGLDVGEPAFDDWVSAKRGYYRARYSDALRASIKQQLAGGAAEGAIERAKNLVDANPDDPDATLLYATTLIGVGRRGEALHALRDLIKSHERSFGSPAPAAVRELEAKLRRTPTEYTDLSARAVKEIFGRDAELSRLVGAWRNVEAGASAVVFLEGPAGVGKTRIVEEFFARTRDLGTPLLLLGRERAAGSGVPYGSIAEALRGTLDAAGLSGTSQHLLAEASRILPQLRDQFSLPPNADVGDEASRLRFFEGVAALLDSVAYEQPVCLALDDLQNSSASTLDLAFYLADRLRSAPILFLFVGRPDPSFLAAKRKFGDSRGGMAQNGSAGQTAISVEPLDSISAAKLARTFAGERLDDSVIGRIVAVSEGYPYRIRESAERALAGLPLGDSPVPLKDVLWGRLKSCSPAEQRLFVAAALLDRPASLRLLAAASHLSEGNALDAALALEREGLVVQRADGIATVHDIAAELALEGTGPAGRALLAGWAAEALMREGGGSEAELANLFAAAGMREESFSYSRKAAYSAAGAGAVDEALRHFQSALSSADSEADRAEMARMVESLRGGQRRLRGEVAPLTAPASSSSAPDTPSAPPPETRREEIAPPPTEQLRPRFWKSRPLLVGLGGIAVALLLVKGISKSRDAVPGTSLRDTLVVAEEISPHQSTLQLITGPIGSPVGIAAQGGSEGTWADSVRVPWINPRLSPGRRFVAMEKMTARGPDLYVVSFDRRDTIPIATGPGDDISVGWSPDGKWILATSGTTLNGGGYDADLYAYSVVERGRRISLDTSADRSVVDAKWSPDGTHIAWTARAGENHQQDIFVSDADGANFRNLSASPAEDYSVTWSPTGDAVAFTSERTGFAELYSVQLADGTLRRLTWDGAYADRAGYSPDGRWMGYESTRGGVASVYVMPSFGGIGRRVSALDKRVTFAGWRGPPTPYLDQLVVSAADFQLPGTARTIVAKGFDQFGRPHPLRGVTFRSLSPALSAIDSSAHAAESGSPLAEARLIALSNGLARIEARAGGWRADTAFVSIGAQSLNLVREDFEHGLSPQVWQTLGAPRPIVTRGSGSGRTSGLLATSDREWESGALSRQVFPMRSGLRVEAWVKAPFQGRTLSGVSFALSLVAADPAGVPDSLAPQFFRLAGISLLGQAGRLSYSVDREIFTEPVSALSPSDSHRFAMRVEPDGSVGFYVDGVRRWKSTLKVRVTGENSRAQLWLSSHAAGSDVVFDDVSVSLEPGSPARANR